MDIQQLDDALYNKYIAPTEKERSTSIGIEIEMPVVALSGKAVEEEAVISAADKFREHFGFEITSRDDKRHLGADAQAYRRTQADVPPCADTRDYRTRLHRPDRQGKGAESGR